MNATPIHRMSAAELAHAIAAKTVSPVEAVRAILARIERAQPILNAYITVAAETALDAARAAEARLMAGERLGPLHGVPFSVKDLLPTAGIRTTSGSLIFKDNVPKEDCLAVKRLKEAGAILIGKTATPEFGHKGTTDAPLFGRTANAWDPTRSSGGSSGGAATAVMAGLGPLAVATDGGGSTRIPAACNGAVGFKQSQGLVPHDQVPDVFNYLAYVTPMTRDVTDTALMLEAMAGPDACDPHSLFAPRGDLVGVALRARELRGVRIGIMPRFGDHAIDREALARFEDAAAVLRGLGAETREMTYDLGAIEPFWLVITHAYWNARFGPHLARHRAVMSPSLVGQLDAARDHSAAELQAALFERSRIYRAVQRWFESVDLVATPTLTRTALPIDHDFFAPIEIEGRKTDTMRRAHYPYTLPFNLTGNPALSLACGFHSDGLPLGLQLIGRRGEDAGVIAAAAAYERATPWHRRRPAIAGLED